MSAPPARLTTLSGRQLQLQPELCLLSSCALMNLSLCLICLDQRVSEERRQAEALPVPAAGQVMGRSRWSWSELSRTPKGFRRIWWIQQLGHTIFLRHCVCVCASLSMLRYGPFSCQRGWKDVCEKGSVWRVCYASYYHGIRHCKLWLRHRFATVKAVWWTC